MQSIRFNPAVLYRNLTLLICLFASAASVAQRKQLPFDSSYYTTYPKMITGRVFFSQKYTSLKLEAPSPLRSLRYIPNTSLNTGFGATYGILTVNVAVPVPFIDRNNDEKGKTKSLDLQTHLYTRNWVADLYGQFYKGYHLRPKGYASPDNSSYYIRPDMKVNVIGAAVYRLMNSDRFSYRAAFLQNEWQKKSAGSLLLGGEIYHGIIKGDSALVPSTLADLYPQKNINKTRFLEFGPGAGYAYTYVYKEHFFATASLTLNGDLSFVKEFREDNTTANEVNVSPNFIFRAWIGYNSDLWAANVSWITNRIAVNGSSSDYKYAINTGNYRITLARRFNPKGLLRKKINKVEEKLPILSTEGK